MHKAVRSEKVIGEMPREGAIIFRDLVGKLEMLRVECDKCGRKGQYRVDHLIEQYGIDAKLFDWEPVGGASGVPYAASGAVDWISASDRRFNQSTF